MNRQISRTSNKIGVFYRRKRLRTVESSRIGKFAIVLCLPACLTLIGCDSRGPAPAVTSSPGQSSTTSSAQSVAQGGGSPIPCQDGAPAGALGSCPDGVQLIQVCGNCDANSGYPTSANRYGWWCSNSLEEAAHMLGFTKNCKVTRVVSQAECCNPSQ